MTFSIDPHRDRPIPPTEPSFVEPVVLAERKPVRGHTLAAWCVIVAISALLAFGMRFRPEPDEPAAAKAGGQDSATMDQIFAKVAEVQGKLIVALSELTRADRTAQGEENRQQMRRQIASMNQGPPSLRLRYVVLAGELAGPDDARSELDQLRRDLARHHHTLDPADDRIAGLLEKIYGSYASDRKQPLNLSSADLQWLHERLGWFADLAVAPHDGPDPDTRKALVRSAQWALAVAALLGLLMGGIACLGFVVLMTLVILAASGRLASQIAVSEVHPGLYAETFACWMALYVGSMLGISALVDALEVDTGRWTAPLIAQALSLFALAWPVVRGARFEDVCRDAGIWLPSRAWLEPLRGIATYALSLPILLLGVMFTLMLIQIQALFTGVEDPFTTPQVPAHPIIESVQEKDPWVYWQVLLLAAVGAPIVEEIMFRGVLYRSLRDSTRGLRVAGSMVASMAISGFLFAVIHPQGWVAIPALGALATGFAIAREWCGTIWPSVVAHAINNGLVTVLLFTLFAS